MGINAATAAEAGSSSKPVCNSEYPINPCNKNGSRNKPPNRATERTTVTSIPATNALLLKSDKFNTGLFFLVSVLIKQNKHNKETANMIYKVTEEKPTRSIRATLY